MCDIDHRGIGHLLFQLGDLDTVATRSAASRFRQRLIERKTFGWITAMARPMATR